MALVWVAYFINYVDRQVVFSILPVLCGEPHFSSTQVGLIGSIFIWVYLLCSPLAGRIADRVRAEILLPASLALWSVATLATGLSGLGGRLALLARRDGPYGGILFPAAVSAVGLVHSGATRSRAIALHGSAQFAGIAAGGWFGGWVAEAWGWRWGFVAPAVVGFAYAPLLRLGIRALGAVPGPQPQPQATARRPPALTRALLLGAFFRVLCAVHHAVDGPRSPPLCVPYM